MCVWCGEQSGSPGGSQPLTLAKGSRTIRLTTQFGVFICSLRISAGALVVTSSAAVSDHDDHWGGGLGVGGLPDGGTCWERWR